MEEHKKTIEYFMTKMTQEEFEKICKPEFQKKERYIFNMIKPVCQNDDQVDNHGD